MEQLEYLFGHDYLFGRFLIQRGLGLIYFVAFLVAYNQFLPLLGQNGIMPVPDFVKRAPFKRFPGIFQYYYSDWFFQVVAAAGLVLSLVALTGLSDIGPVWLSVLVWLLLWVLYQSVVNAGQLFYSFGWESMLLEAGFYAIWLGPLQHSVPLLPIFIIRWMLFRVEFGAGLIKIRGDRCWRDLTCMLYHHETQPMPNLLSRKAHHAPAFLHKTETAFNHFVQLIAIWGIFFPQPIAGIAALLIIVSQLYLMSSGNYSWLNLLTIMLAFSAVPDGFYQHVFGWEYPFSIAMPPLYYQIGVILMTLLIIYFSILPVKNLVSRFQLMNYSFNPLHLVNTYGAFGSVTKYRYEIIIEGTDETDIHENTSWYAYEFKGKPGDPAHTPPQVAPYHLRLDWQIWFSAMRPFAGEQWFFGMIKKLLQNDQRFLRLLRYNPFPDTPPRYIRAQRYLYRYTTRHEKKQTGQYWHRTYANEYMPPVDLAALKKLSIMSVL